MRSRKYIIGWTSKRNSWKASSSSVVSSVFNKHAAMRRTERAEYQPMARLRIEPVLPLFLDTLRTCRIITSK